jgi:hypothetical protein
MKKVALLIIPFVLWACASTGVHKINFAKDYSPEKVRRVAILNFNRGPDIRLSQDFVVDKFTAAMVGSRFILVDRTDIKKIMEEAKFQNIESGIIDEKTRQKLQQLGADAILTGTLHSYSESKNAQHMITHAEVYLTAKLLRVETGEILWSAEIMKDSKMTNAGEKKKMGIIGGESESESAVKLLDEIISDMGDSFKEKRKLLNIF